jgi:hypothetical protein
MAAFKDGSRTAKVETADVDGDGQVDLWVIKDDRGSSQFIDYDGDGRPDVVGQFDNQGTMLGQVELNEVFSHPIFTQEYLSGMDFTDVGTLSVVAHAARELLSQSAALNSWKAVTAAENIDAQAASLRSILPGRDKPSAEIVLTGVKLNPDGSVTLEGRRLEEGNTPRELWKWVPFTQKASQEAVLLAFDSAMGELGGELDTVRGEITRTWTVAQSAAREIEGAGVLMEDSERFEAYLVSSGQVNALTAGALEEAVQAVVRVPEVVEVIWTSLSATPALVELADALDDRASKGVVPNGAKKLLEGLGDSKDEQARWVASWLYGTREGRDVLGHYGWSATERQTPRDSYAELSPGRPDVSTPPRSTEEYRRSHWDQFYEVGDLERARDLSDSLASRFIDQALAFDRFNEAVTEFEQSERREESIKGQLQELRKLWEQLARSLPRRQ